MVNGSKLSSGVSRRPYLNTLRMLDQIETQYLLRLREDREEVKHTATEVGVMGEGDMRRRLDKETSSVRCRGRFTKL